MNSKNDTETQQALKTFTGSGRQDASSTWYPFSRTEAKQILDKRREGQHVPLHLVTAALWTTEAHDTIPITRYSSNPLTIDRFT